jgi:undecaprenyl-diphosphatase
MIDIFQAIVLAIIQGITAWIPVSSKTQVILAGSAFFSLPFKECLAFALILHCGDFIAAIFKYRNEYIGAVVAAVTKPAELASFEKADEIKKEHLFLVISIVATAIVALPAYFIVRKVFTELSGEWLLAAVGVLLFVMAAITVIAKKAIEQNAKISISTALITGFAQGLAVIPGISRSGITQCSLLLQGIEPQKAVRLSFMMSAPMVAAAFVAFYFVEGFEGFSIEVIAVGIVIAAVASFVTMDVLTKIARKIPSHYFLASIGLLALVPLLIKLLVGAGD